MDLIDTFYSPDSFVIEFGSWSCPQVQLNARWDAQPRYFGYCGDLTSAVPAISEVLYPKHHRMITCDDA